MVDPGWYLSQNLGIEGLVIEVLMVWLGQTSKTADTLILPSVSAHNQPMPQPTGGANNWNFIIIELRLGLIIGQVCSKALHSIMPMVLRVLEFGGYYSP